MSTDVLILGGGIGGLAAAHDLRQRGFKGSIRIIERNNKVGGQARSDVIPGTQLPTEYSWRVYGPRYVTLRRMMKQIPYYHQTVYDNLTEIPNVIVPQNNGKFFQFQTRGSSIVFKYLAEAVRGNSCMERKLIEKFLYLMTSSQERLRAELQNTTWEEYFGSLSKKAYDYIVRMNAAVFGADVYKCSVIAVLEILRPPYGNETSSDLAVMNGPTSERFFDPWQKYLESLGVDILVNARVTDIVLQNENKINYVVIQTEDGNTLKYSATNYIFDLPIEVMAELTTKSYQGLGIPVPTSISHWPKLANESKQQIVGMQLYFDQKFYYPDPKRTMLFMVESPWQLIILPTVAWNDFDMQERDPKGQIKDGWTLALCDQRVPGWKIKKPWPECTREEIEEEVWAQIIGTPGLIAYLPDLKNISKPAKSYLWYSYQPNQFGILDTWEPKFSSNAGTWEQRPDIFLPWKDAYLATAYVRGSQELIRMDAAAEAGARVAEQILTNKNHLPRDKPLDKRSWALLFAPLWFVDRKRVQKSKDHLANAYFGGSSIVLMMLYILVVVIVLILIGGLIYYWIFKWGNPNHSNNYC